ncbi:hypothetical protein IO99_05375 [Clostridium sulfidigenes]|uniref:Uncharacterized protein n=1 Tax=Clostridium sulfidigenes TaxID=318464 RepID=A0A084JEX4_9CLOT|nr:DUF4352 domain-containing protein [Clostridium sulfidigenes]KEZ87508.1 hypothetical protein IO99_05375 [Clostridium sulfidigenes]
MRGKVIYKIIIAAMFICSVYILIVKGMPIPGKNVWNNEEIVEEDGDNGEEEERKEESELRLYQIGEEVTFGSYTYKVNSAMESKEKGNFPAPTDYSKRYTFDESGNITGDDSYVVVNLTIVNNTKEIKELYLNSMALVVYKNNTTTECDYSECVSSSKLEGYGRKDYFRTDFEPSVEYTYDLVFIIPDQSLKTKRGRLVISRQDPSTRKEDEDKTRLVEVNF